MAKYTAHKTQYTRYGLPVISREAADIAYEKLSLMLKYASGRGEAYFTKMLRKKLRQIKEENPELYRLYRTLKESSDLIQVDIGSLVKGDLSKRIKLLEARVAQERKDRGEYIDLACIVLYDALNNQARLSFQRGTTKK